MSPQFTDKQIIIHILHQSFLDNQSVNFVIKQDQRKSERIRKLMEYSYFQGEKFGKIYLSKDKNTCAIVLHPEKKKTTFKSILWDIRLVVNCIGIRNVSKVLKRESEIRKNHPDFPFVHLWYIGVDPNVQGKGNGTKLIQEIIADSEKLNLPIYLETSNTRNFPFYEKSGFKVLHEMNSLGYCLKMFLKN